MKEIYDRVCVKTSEFTTHSYSTSFSLGIRSLSKELRSPICSIYGFVRFADEIVDTFHDYPQKEILNNFRQDTFKAIEIGFSINPILHAFQLTVNKYKIPHNLIETFLHSMEMDLEKSEYINTEELDTYILGSAEVVGLMCLKIFVNGDEGEYHRLSFSAKKLGAAFQKVNFLRDLKDDLNGLGRTYFPSLSGKELTTAIKKEIESDIALDFTEALKGIKKLPPSSKFGVFLAYTYYYSLFRKIKKRPASQILNKRIRIPNPEKMVILFSTFLKYRLNINL